MNLPGQLKLTTLGDLLGVLHRASASGVLELQEGNGSSSHRVYLESGLVDAVETRLGNHKLGEVLMRRGLLSLNGIRALLRCLSEQPQKKAGQILVDERLIDPSILDAALRLQLKERLNALFGVRDASVRFHVRRWHGGSELKVPLSPREFLHGRSRTRARSDAAPRAEARDAADKTSLYRTLGLAPGATAENVRKAFRKLAAEHHPDRFPQASDAQRTTLAQRFSQISAAYHELCRTAR